MTEFQHEAPAVPQSVSELRNALADYVRSHGAGEEMVMAVQLATSEAMSNAVVHAFVDRPEPGKLTLEAGRDGDEIWVLVEDDGSGMRPRPDSPGIGLGLPLIARMTAGFELHERDGGGTELRMRFRL